MKKILVTGFAPFAGEDINPAWQTVQGLPHTLGGAVIITQKLPTVFTQGGKELLENIQKERPDIVLCLGQAGGRATLSLEKVAINLRDTTVKDNAGAQPRNEIIEPLGADGYFTNLPLQTLQEALKAQEIPCHISYSAGTYVCNDVMYQLLHYIRTQAPQRLGGFLHVPFIPKQALEKSPQTPSLPLEYMIAGVKTILSTLLEYDIQDISPVG